MKHRSHRRIAIAALAVAGTMSAFWGCNATPGNTGFGGGGAGTTSGSHGGNGGGSLIDVDSGTGGGSHVDDAGACSATSASASLIPLDMIILLDKSGSMSGSSWTTVTGALKNFIADPASDGIGVGLVFFPNNKSDDCIPADYANLDVDVAPLPGNKVLLQDKIDATSPTGMTPTWGALKGALQAATSYQDANPTHKVIVVLATDGDPTSCTDTDSAVIAALAKSARNYNGVQTYAIGFNGATMSNLDEIAAAGGTGTGFDVTNDITQFSAKMAEIRSNALACEVLMPPPPVGEQLDPGKVNVSFTPGGQTTSTNLPNVVNAAACGNKAAWYYDNNAAPKKIMLCPATCTSVKGDSAAKLDILFGCKTIAG
jgi:uncharacterized protein YegL